MIIIPKGFAIFCPKCRIPLMTAKRDIMEGDRSNEDDFEMLTEHTRPGKGSRPTCGECGTYFVGGNMLPVLLGIPEEKIDLTKDSDQVRDPMDNSHPILPTEGNEVQNG